MFAATTCSSVSSPATLRENLLRRGSTASMVPLASSPVGRTATQSPTAASSLRLIARCLKRPACCSFSSPLVERPRKM